MPITFPSPDPTTSYEVAADGTLIVECRAARGPEIRLAFDRRGLDSSTPLGGRRVTPAQALEAICQLGRDADNTQITINTYWRAAVIEEHYRN